MEGERKRWREMAREMEREMEKETEREMEREWRESTKGERERDRLGGRALNGSCVLNGVRLETRVCMCLPTSPVRTMRLSCAGQTLSHCHGQTLTCATVRLCAPRLVSLTSCAAVRLCPLPCSDCAPTAVRSPWGGEPPWCCRALRSSSKNAWKSFIFSARRLFP